MYRDIFIPPFNISQEAELQNKDRLHNTPSVRTGLSPPHCPCRHHITAPGIARSESEVANNVSAVLQASFKIHPLFPRRHQVTVYPPKLFKPVPQNPCPAVIPIISCYILAPYTAPPTKTDLEPDATSQYMSPFPLPSESVLMLCSVQGAAPLTEGRISSAKKALALRVECRADEVLGVRCPGEGRHTPTA